jgi:hypothetical protein
MKTHSIIIILLAVCIFNVYADATVQEIKGLLTKNLVFTGNLSISDSSQSQLYFLYYGVTNVLSRTDLANYPTLIVFGR